MRSYLQEPVAKKLPDATEVTIDKKHYYRQFLHGYYQFDCIVKKGLVRSTKFYIPEGSIYNQPTVFIGIPGGRNPWEFMVTCGWKELSDRYGLYLVLMEPLSGHEWEKCEADLAYLEALSNDLAVRPMFCSFQASFYLAAYEDAADVCGIHSLRSPRAYAATALIGGNGITIGEESYLNQTLSRVPGISLAQVQHPVWLTFDKTDEDVQREILIYRNANHSQQNGVVSGTKTTWHPEIGGTKDEQWCADVTVDFKHINDCTNREYSEKILTELFDGVFRYPGNNNGALRIAGNIYDRGFLKFSGFVWGGYYEDKRDTYRREWYVYLPNSAPRNQKIPLLFVFHGAGGSGDEIADRMGWSSVADEYGFMIVMPSASEPDEVREVSDIRTNNIFRPMWNTGRPHPERPEDMRFLDYLYRWVLERYPVDKSRVYGSGQSSGGMMSWACAAYRPDYFAAVAPFSARHIDIEAQTWEEPEQKPVNGSPVAIAANMGCCDMAFKGGFSQAQELIDYWCSRYHLTKHWSDYTYMDGGKNCSHKDGMFTRYIFENEEKIPMLSLTETDTKAHAAWPSECEWVWREFLSKFSKNTETGTLFYGKQSFR